MTPKSLFQFSDEKNEKMNPKNQIGYLKVCSYDPILSDPIVLDPIVESYEHA